jgi:hypothetical protein
MAKGSIEVSTYIPPVAVSPPPAPSHSKGSLLESQRTVGALAAMVSLALHFLMLTPLIWGGGVFRARQADVRTSADLTGQAAGGFAMQWVNLEETSGPSGRNNDYSTATHAFSDPPLQSVTLSALPAEVRSRHSQQWPGNENNGGDTPRSADSSDERVERSQVFGLYISQIEAQIDRAWLRPRTPLDVPLFSCRARIGQDSSGNVREVTLELCTADARWQQSLIRAIESASPLPPPSDPSVFVSVLRISFEAVSYSPTAPPEKYEPSLTGSADRPPVPPTIQRNPGS